MGCAKFSINKIIVCRKYVYSINIIISQTTFRGTNTIADYLGLNINLLTHFLKKSYNAEVYKTTRSVKKMYIFKEYNEAEKAVEYLDSLLIGKKLGNY